MARREVVTVTDDFDGSDNAATVRFGLDGDTYEVDLSAVNEEELRGFLSHYIRVGRRLSTSGRPYTATNPECRPAGGPRLGRRERGAGLASGPAQR